MKSSQSRPVLRTRSVCVIEVVRDDALRPKWWECVISIPGHPGAFSRTFSTPMGILDDSDVRDLTTWLLQTVQNTIYASAGVQAMFVGLEGSGEPGISKEPPVGA